jgi:hypothetical protein
VSDAVHPGQALLYRIRSLALKQANLVRARPAMVAKSDDAATLETLEATAALVDILQTDPERLPGICERLARLPKDAA